MKNSERKLRTTKRVLNFVLIVLPLLYLGFIIADRFGVWDRLSGLDDVERIAARFELSYAPDASHPVRVGDAEWKPLLQLVNTYSNAQLPSDKEPRVIARYVAVSSARTPPEGPIIAEWTAPSTPLFSCIKIGLAM